VALKLQQHAAQQAAKTAQWAEVIGYSTPSTVDVGGLNLRCLAGSAVLNQASTQINSESAHTSHHYHHYHHYHH
jgi:hypothetical protein